MAKATNEMFWAFSEQMGIENKSELKSATSLQFSRECELAIENYNVKKSLFDEQNRNKELQMHISRLKSALAQSAGLVDELKRRNIKSSREENALRKELLEIKDRLSRVESTKKCLTHSYSRTDNKIQQIHKKAIKFEKECMAIKESLEHTKKAHLVDLQQVKEKAAESLIVVKDSLGSMTERFEEKSKDHEKALKKVESLSLEIAALKDLVAQREREKEEMVSKVQETDVYRTLHEAYEEVIFEMVEIKGARDKYLKGYEKLKGDLHRLIVVALQEGCAIPSDIDDEFHHDQSI